VDAVTPTIPLVPLLHGTMSIPVAGGFPSSNGVSIGNEVPSSNGFSGSSKPGAFPANGGPQPTPGLDAIDGLLARPDSAGPTAGLASGPTAGLASGPTAGLASGLTAGVTAGHSAGLTAGHAGQAANCAGLAAAGEAAGLPWQTRVRRRVHSLSPASALHARLSIFLDDPRTPSRVRHGAAAVCLGAVVAVLAGWQLGLAVALLTTAAGVLYRTRASPVVPAAVRAVSAQRRTRRRLSRLASAGYLSLHARHLPGTDTVADHLVVGPAGLYLMASERWDRRLPVHYSQGGQLFHGPFDQSSRIEHTRRMAAQVSMRISRALAQPITVHPAMVIHGPAVPWVVARIGGVDVLCGHRLRRYLRREKSANRGRCLDEMQIVFLHAVASQLLPPARDMATAGQRARGGGETAGPAEGA